MTNDRLHLKGIAGPLLLTCTLPPGLKDLRSEPLPWLIFFNDAVAYPTLLLNESPLTHDVFHAGLCLCFGVKGWVGNGLSPTE